MILILKIICLLSVLFFVHSYLIYPLHLYVLYSIRKKNNQVLNYRDFDLPVVSCIISVYNESNIIARKIQSLLDSDYPQDKIRIYVGSDSSTDSSNEILTKYSNEDPRILFFYYKNRRGKTIVINDLIEEAFKNTPQSNNHILLFTDANVILSHKVVYYLCRHFIDNNVALVDSKIIPFDLRSYGISKSENEYMNLEIKLKFIEGEIWGVMMGAFGGCFALRSSYFEKIPSNFIVDDFFISMNALSKGGLCKNDLEAICYEGKPDQLIEEFKRKARISAGNYQNLRYYYKVLFKKPVSLAYAFFSHKVLRWTAPIYLLIGLLAMTILVLKFPGIYLVYYKIIAFILIILPVLDYVLGKMGIHIKLLRGNRYFILMNIALLFGFIRYVVGIKKSSWEPPKRNII